MYLKYMSDSDLGIQVRLRRLGAMQSVCPVEINKTPRVRQRPKDVLDAHPREIYRSIDDELVLWSCTPDSIF